MSNVRLAHAASTQPAERRYKLGLVTYMIAADWDLGTIIERCKAAGIAAIEFRTTHKHGVEHTLNKEQRDAVKKNAQTVGWCFGA